MLGSNKTSKPCSIIIVTYNSSSYIRGCLTPFVGMPDFEFVVVDNNSQDGSTALVEKEFPFVKIISLEVNLGFGRACNIGVAASSGSFIFLLNPDAVASPHALKKVIAFLEDHPQAGIVGASLTDLLGQPLESMGDRPSLLRLVLEKPIAWLAKRVGPRGLFRMLIGRVSTKFRLPSEPELVPWVSGAALCCRRSTWEEIRGFDEKFFLYYEDVDLCLRASQAGWGVWHVPDAVVEHQSGASFGGDVYKQKTIYYANQYYFFRKHFGPWTAGFLSVFQNVYFRLALYRQF
jgi:N-acetylglucosaminyl-diphospho-decaprenol L-rhamnosyltransferase